MQPELLVWHIAAAYDTLEDSQAPFELLMQIVSETQLEDVCGARVAVMGPSAAVRVALVVLSSAPTPIDDETILALEALLAADGWPLELDERSLLELYRACHEGTQQPGVVHALEVPVNSHA